MRSCYFSGWSNFECTGTFSYTSLKELKRFKDDPKTKMRGKFRNISDLFNGLLFRKDFVESGLLLSNCGCSSSEMFEQASKLRKVVVVPNGNEMGGCQRLARTGME